MSRQCLPRGATHRYENLGHLDAELLEQSDREVQRVHGIEVELIPELHGALQARVPGATSRAPRIAMPCLRARR